MASSVGWIGFALILYLQCSAGQRNNRYPAANNNNQRQQAGRPNAGNYYRNFLTHLCRTGAAIVEQAETRLQECVRCFNESLPCVRGQARPPFDFTRARECVDTFLLSQLSPCGNLLMGTNVSPNDSVHKEAFYACLRSLGWAETIKACLVAGVTGRAFLNCSATGPPRTAAEGSDAELLPSGSVRNDPPRRVRPGGTPVELPARPPFATGPRQGRDLDARLEKQKLQQLRLEIEALFKEG